MVSKWISKVFVKGFRIFLLWSFILGLLPAQLVFNFINPIESQAAAIDSRSAGYALEFDGADDYVRVEDIGNFDFDETMTLEAWVKPDSVDSLGGFRGIVSGRSSQYPNSSGSWVMYAHRDDASQWGLSVCTPTCSAALAPSGSLVVGEWAHIAATYDGSTIKIYQNGVLIGSAAKTGSVGSITNLFIGAWSSAFNGIIDEVRVWNIARTEAEIQSTMMMSLNGDETGLVGYWRFDEGSGQTTADSTSFSQDGQLGETLDIDEFDPTWVVSDAPIDITTSPIFQLIPAHGGLGTEIGVTSWVGEKPVCDWVPGETVELRWDDPDVPVATFVADEEGCFQGLFKLDDSEVLVGSEDGQHTISANGSSSGSGAYAAEFFQTRSKLYLDPYYGPRGLSVTLSGCDWPTGIGVDLYWSDDLTFLGQAGTDNSGCIKGTITIPEGKDGIIPLYGIASSNTDIYSGAAFWRRSATVVLTPAEGPPGSHVPLAGSYWNPDETVDFYWETTGELIESWQTNENGQIDYAGSIDPFIRIPTAASLGEHTIRAVGNSSKQTVLTPFTVMERTLSFDPDTGYAGDVIYASGCGWVENSTVTLEWGYPDPNNLPIRWSAPVDSTTACFGLDGSFSITVPSNTITGPVTVTAMGDVSGDIDAEFNVLHDGQISLLVGSAYAGDEVDVQISDAIVGETISFKWDDGTVIHGVGAATADFLTSLTIPLSASVGVHTITADGTKGFYDSEDLTVLDGSEISVITVSPFYAGESIEIQGDGWGAGESVTLALSLDGVNWTTVGTQQVGSEETSFTTDIFLPYELGTGTYTLRAVGDKGRVAETSLFISEIAFYSEADYASPPPVLDGNLNLGEWDYDNAIDFANGSIVVSNDESRLYVLLDVLDDNGQDAIGADNFWLSFDIWDDGKIDGGWDLNFRLDLSGDFILEEYDGQGGFDPRNSTFLRSAYAPGFGCFYADGSFRITFNGFLPVFTCDNHRIWEIAIDLQTLGINPGDIARMGVRLISETPGFTEDIPANFTNDFSELGAILLESSQIGPMPNGDFTDIGVDGYTIEVTQTVQDRDNTIKLVANKDTAVRIYPNVQAESTLRVFLFGQRDGVDLPGSPLLTTAVIPPGLDPDLLENTANFLLPSSWILPGITSFTVVAERLDGSQTTTATRSVTFYERHVPNYWIVPINTGTSTSPTIPSSAQIILQQSYLETAFPLHDVDWTIRPWDDLGSNVDPDLDEIMSDLETLYSDTAVSYIASGKDLSEMPEQIYGFLADSVGGGGKSKPVWSGGNGVASAGSFGGSTSREGVMAHEINHNLDKKENPTWGRHVTDDDDDTTNVNWGCTAKGGDPNWEGVNGSDDEIGNLGFDTRLPWQLGSGGIRTVIPSNYPDLMSYCRSSGETNGESGQLPTKWISAYRWNALFGQYAPSTGQAQNSLRAVDDQILYISGKLNKDGSGELNPIRIMPGVPTPTIFPGDFTLEVRDVTGLETLLSVPFIGSFIDSEGEEVDFAYFNYQIPFPSGGAQVVLLHGNDVIDVISASANPPSVAITSPIGGENWIDEAEIMWDAVDADGDELIFSLFYSPDEGLNWYPIKSGIKGNSYSVNVGRLPGGSGGKIRIIATDGFNTVTEDSSGVFVVPDPGVLVAIQSPIMGSKFSGGEVINLVGSGYKVTGEAFDESSLVWSIDDEAVGIGDEIDVQLSPGVYTIALTAYGEEGIRGTDSIEITVNEIEDPNNQIFLPLINR